jgi:hypothetical protein
MTIYTFCDIETFATDARAVVPAVGILRIHLNEQALNYEYVEVLEMAASIKFDVGEQVQLGRNIDPSTMAWWAKQPPAAQKSVAPDGTQVSFKEFLPWITETFGPEEPGDKATWWFRGPHFDAAILQNLFEDFGHRTPWNFWEVRDTRTWFECYTGSTKPFSDPEKLPAEFIAHDPKHDVALDCFAMLQVMKAEMES